MECSICPYNINSRNGNGTGCGESVCINEQILNENEQFYEENVSKFNVLSLFDGISCGRVALERAKIPVGKYYASEIDKYAIQVTQDNYPDTIQLGDINNYMNWQLDNIDLVIGGSPCQDFSTLNRERNGLNGNKSSLFFRFVDCLERFKPKYFLLENNSNMPKSAKEYISEVLGVQPIEINSSLVSGQFRKRLYWTNIPNVALPADKNIKLQDLLKKHPYINEIQLVDWTKRKLETIKQKFGKIPEMFCPYVCTEIKDKHYCLTAQGNSQTKSSSNIIFKDNKFYMPNADFWEILQTLPNGYTKVLEKENKRKTVIGNGWTVDVIAHIFNNLKGE